MSDNVHCIAVAQFSKEWADRGVTAENMPDCNQEPISYMVWKAMMNGYWANDYFEEYASDIYF